MCIYSNEYLNMENLDPLSTAHQGSEAAFQHTQERDQDGAPEALEWLEGKNKQMADFLNKLEQEGIQRNKFKVQL